MEYDFSVDKDGANILNIANTSDKVAFVTYKNSLVLLQLLVQSLLILQIVQ